MGSLIGAAVRRSIRGEGEGGKGGDDVGRVSLD